MLSLRMLGRIAPRTAFRSAPIRTLSSLSRNSSLRPAYQSFNKTSYPAFSTSIARREPAGESDQVLSQKLSQERSLELESRDDQLPEDVQAFLDNSSWKLDETTGKHNSILTKDFGNETIKVEFTVNDLMENTEDMEHEDMDEDGAIPDEGFDEPPKAINQAGAKDGKVDILPEDSLSPSDRGESTEVDAAMPPEYPMRFNVTITKPGGKNLYIIAQHEDGALQILGMSNSPLDEKNLDSGYEGPPMESLDPDLQAMLEQYLEERGIDANLAQFAYQYNDHKEQREYVNWLQKLQDFIDA